MNKLLIVEDESMTSDLLCQYFEMVGYSVVSALTGSEAIARAIEHQPSVIILDIMLPDMDGYHVCKRLRSDARTGHIPIIFLTQRDDRRDRLDGLGLGADDYLTKPFDVEELRIRIHNVLEQVGSAPPAETHSGLPDMEQIKQRLPELLADPENFFLDAQIEFYWEFQRQYGPVASGQVTQMAAGLIGELLYELGVAHAFIGLPQEDHFLVVFPRWAADHVWHELPLRFSEQVIAFYDYPDQQQGMMREGHQWVPFMVLRLIRIKRDALWGLVRPRGRNDAGREPQSNANRGGRRRRFRFALPAPGRASQPPESDF